jgi:hypothetical protein
VSGHSAYRFVRMIAEAGCTEPSYRDGPPRPHPSEDFELWADVDRDDVWDPSRDARIASGPFHTDVTPSTYSDLFPGTLLIAHEDPKPSVGKVRTTTEPRSYVYFVKSKQCRPEKLSLFLESEVTGASLRLELDQPSTDLRVATTAANPDEVPALVAGDRSPHPWSFPATPVPEVVHLGPGVVTFLESKEFGAHQRVEIAAGTRIELGPDASLSFSGPLFALGDRRRPIAIVRSDDGRPFGGIAIVGPATAGSRLHHVEIRGGSGDQLEIFHTRDIEITDALIDTATRAADLIHANFVDGLRLQDVVVRNAPTDAVDLEFTTADVRGLDVVDAGDDCLDLMGSHVRLIDSVLLGCTNNGISAGEETEIVVHGGSIAESKIGVLAKNASDVRITRSLVYKTEIALQAKLREIHYSGESRIVANELAVVECDEVLQTARGTKIEPGRVHRTLPDSNDIDRRLLQLRGGAR